MEINSNLPIFVAARLPFGIPKSVVSCIQLMQDYTAHETEEVVRPAPF